MSSNVSSKARFRINTPTISHETIDGETVIINLENGSYYSMDGIGAEIWSAIESGLSSNDIVEIFDKRYDGAGVYIENSIIKLMTELQREGLIVPDIKKGTGSSEDINKQIETGDREEKPPFKAPILNKYNDMQDLLLLDPIHEVDESGWPTPKASEE